MSEFTRKSSRSPTLQKVAMERMRRELNKAAEKPAASIAAAEKRDREIVMKHLRSARGPASKFYAGRGVD